MKPYEWVLFDADDTLFHFDAYQGLQLMFTQYGIDFTKEHYQEYQTKNLALWVDYQNGKITAQQLKNDRFSAWAGQAKTSPAELNQAFLVAMAMICTPIDGAVSLLTMLKGNSRLGIITNGFTDLQQVRLERTGLAGYFDLVVISEELGVAKPHPAIFEHALLKMGNPDRNLVLMVGDNPDSDILGGIQAGLDTCWLNRHGKPLPDSISPRYHVSSLSELEELLKPYLRSLQARGNIS